MNPINPIISTCIAFIDFVWWYISPLVFRSGSRDDEIMQYSEIFGFQTFQPITTIIKIITQCVELYPRRAPSTIIDQRGNQLI